MRRSIAWLPGNAGCCDAGRVDVGRARGERQAEAGLASMKFKLAEQIRRAPNAATLLQDIRERVLPFPGLQRFDGRVLIDRDVSLWDFSVPLGF